MTLEILLNLLGIVVVACPFILFTVLGVTSLFSRPLGERSVAWLTEACGIIGLIALLSIVALMLLYDLRNVPVEFGNLVVIADQHFHFNLKFVFDRLSIPFAILTYVLCGVVAAFTSRYLHREPGYGRFFVFYAIFQLGMIISSLAGTIETLFLGWELVGLSSALLVAYFHERRNPVRNGLRVWSVYRIADAAFLIAALMLHHLTGEGDFEGLMGTGPWPEGQSTISQSAALWVGLLLLVAAAGKSALIPFSGWLPRAMEGPTPSSAVFYGALSVHLGAFLLLRVSPILEQSLFLSAAVVLLGLSTAIFAAMTSRVQTDIKTALAFASLTQVGIIVAEIGFGFRYLALVHILGHACLRTLQLLRAPSLLHDYHSLQNAIGSHLPHGPSMEARLAPTRGRKWLYRFSLERGYLDAILSEYVARPFLAFFRRCREWEKRWLQFLSGEAATTSDELPSHINSVEDLV